MSEMKKATCRVPSIVISACRKRFSALHARSPAAGYAQIISDGIALIARGSETAPKLADLCYSKYPRFELIISTHISASVREQARQLKRARGFGSFQELYLEAVLKSLVERGVMTVGLEAKADDGGSAEPAAGRRRAA